MARHTLAPVCFLLVALLGVTSALDRPALIAAPRRPVYAGSTQLYAKKKDKKKDDTPWQEKAVKTLNYMAKETKQHLLSYIFLSYAVVMGIYSIFIYCFCCPYTTIKKLLPAFFALLHLRVASVKWVARDGPALLKTLPQVFTVLNYAAVITVFADMTRCYMSSRLQFAVSPVE